MTYPITTNLVAISPLSCFSPGIIIIWEENAPNGCWDNCVTSTFDLTNEIDLGFSRSIFSCDQAALQMVQSVCLSVCLSVRLSVRPSVTPLSLCSHHRIIMKFPGVITNDKSDVHAKGAKGQGQRSKVKVTEVKTPLVQFRIVTPVWIRRWLWNDVES